VRWEKQFHRDYTNMKQAEGLLRDDNLVWSEDFNYIRLALADLLGKEAAMGHYARPETKKLALLLLDVENDLSI